MAKTSNSTRITLTSNPHKQRVGVVPMCAIIAMGLGISMAMIIEAVLLMREPANVPYAIYLILLSLSFMTLLGLYSAGLMRDNYRDYILELTDSEAILVVVDRLHKRRGVQMVLLEDISFAEYYPYSDQAAIILHTPYTDMEVPLWPLTNQGRDVVDYLDGRGVKIVNVQSDEPIPDR